MTAFIRSRHLIPLLCLCGIAVGLVFSPSAEVPAPYLDLGSPGPLVPLRAIALVCLGHLPVLALSPDTAMHDAAGARSAVVLRAAAPLLLTVVLAVTVAAMASLVRVDPLAAVRNMLLGAGISALLVRVMGPLSFLPAVMGALWCAALREQHAWWAVTNQPGTVTSLGAAVVLVVGALTIAALRRG